MLHPCVGRGHAPADRIGLPLHLPSSTAPHLALPLGELAAKPTERALTCIFNIGKGPLRLAYGEPPLPKGEARRRPVAGPAVWVLFGTRIVFHCPLYKERAAANSSGPFVMLLCLPGGWLPGRLGPWLRPRRIRWCCLCQIPGTGTGCWSNSRSDRGFWSGSSPHPVPNFES